jgi:polysaccharide export outer membrane protein
MSSIRRSVIGAVWCVVALTSVPAAAQVNNDYTIGARDVLSVTVFGQADLTGKYLVDLDGTFVFPLIGTVKAGGLSARQISAEIQKRLEEGFLQSPQVTVSVEDYRSRRVFVVGQVHQPGAYPLSGEMTLIEVLARAGSTTPDAAPEALIVHAKDASGPKLPNEASSVDVSRVNLNDLQRGGSTMNLALHDGDTVFIPRAETVFVSGEVRTPGSYPIGKDTTVLQALTLAGGVNENGAQNRIRILRVIRGQREELKVKLTDVVQAGDTIVVPERFF